jgi:hypothetical protein
MPDALKFTDIVLPTGGTLRDALTAQAFANEYAPLPDRIQGAVFKSIDILRKEITNGNDD